MRLSTWFSLIFYFWAAPLWASDYHSPRTTALGGAGHAGPLLNDAIYLNPSYTSFLPTYGISANYLHFTGPEDLHGHAVNASIQDGRSEMFQAGVGLTLSDDSRSIHVGASRAFVRRVGVGIGGKFIFPRDPSMPSLHDSTLSMTGIVTPWLQTVLVIDNVIESPDERALQMYRETIVATKINVMEIAMLYIDPHFTPHLPGDTQWGYEVGLELSSFRDLYIRFGKFKNAYVPNERRYADGFGLGIGWIGPRLSFDYGYGRVTQTQSSLHNIGVTLFF